jgi:peroxiredoxin
MPTASDPGQLGMLAADFRLPGVDGRDYTLQDVAGKRGTLVMFICNHCPYVRAVIDRIARDAAELKTYGIGSVAISANDAEAYPDDSFANMKRFAEEHRLQFPYLHDESQQVARSYGAICTPDFFGFDAGLKLQYRGRLDDSGRNPKPSAQRELFEAMRQLAETGIAPAEQTPSIGCSIKWKPA